MLLLPNLLFFVLLCTSKIPFKRANLIHLNKGEFLKGGKDFTTFLLQRERIKPPLRVRHSMTVMIPAGNNMET